jgi:3-oxoacyl-[acyl-carrier-protein] synthase III
MIRVSHAHIAGIAVSQHDAASSHTSIASAVTKALLDAGLAYSDVNLAVNGSLSNGLRIPRTCLQVFGMTGAPILDVDNQSVLFTAAQFIRSRQAKCVLLVAFDKVKEEFMADPE